MEISLCFWFDRLIEKQTNEAGLNKKTLLLTYYVAQPSEAFRRFL